MKTLYGHTHDILSIAAIHVPCKHPNVIFLCHRICWHNRPSTERIRRAITSNNWIRRSNDQIMGCHSTLRFIYEFNRTDKYCELSTLLLQYVVSAFQRQKGLWLQGFLIIQLWLITLIMESKQKSMEWRLIWKASAFRMKIPSFMLVRWIIS